MTAEHPLAAYGWSDRVRALMGSADRSLRPGRVARVDRGLLTAVTGAGVARVPTRGLDVTTGDWILLTPAEPPAVAEVLPRWSALGRHDPGRAGDTQLLAANIDVGFVVAALDRGPGAPRLDRLLTLVWASGATPVVVLAKADLVADPGEVAEAVARTTVGADVVVASTVTGQGLDRLRALLPPACTAVVIGQSGAGKSSLVNALVGDEVQATGEVRAGDRRGRHTTRARELMPVPAGGVLLDTPGIRAVALTAGQGAGLEHTFADIVELAEGCRFADCRHDTEPGCAVAAAVASGDLDPGRVDALRALEQEVASAERRADVRADRAASRTTGRRHRQIMEELRRTRHGR